MQTRLLTPVDNEFLEELKALLGSGMFGNLKQRLIAFSLEILRMSLLGHTHPFETLRGMSNLQWEDLLENPYTPSVINQALDDLERCKELSPLIEILHREDVMQRLQVEWLYDVTVGRFEHTVPYLYKEEELLQGWQEEAKKWKDSSTNPFQVAEQEAQRVLYIRGSGMSETAKRLFLTSFLAACRKIFINFSGAKETWIGSYSLEGFKIPSASGKLGAVLAKQDSSGRGRLLLRFGLVDHVFYLKPTLEQINLFVECIRLTDLVCSVQQKLCPFVSLAGDGPNFNLMAEVFYKVYQPQRLRAMRVGVNPVMDEAFLQTTGLSKGMYDRLGFIPLSEDELVFFRTKIEALPRLRAFLHNPRTETGLIRQRLYRSVLDQLLTHVTQESLVALCSKWNPLVSTPGGGTTHLMDYVEGRADVKVGKIQASDTDAQQRVVEISRQRVIREELFHILAANTQAWQQAMEEDSFILDTSREFFMTILNKALEESGTEEYKRDRYRDSYRVACVLVD